MIVYYKKIKKEVERYSDLRYGLDQYRIRVGNKIVSFVDNKYGDFIYKDKNGLEFDFQNYDDEGTYSINYGKVHVIFKGSWATIDSSSGYSIVIMRDFNFLIKSFHINVGLICDLAYILNHISPDSYEYKKIMSDIV